MILQTRDFFDIEEFDFFKNECDNFKSTDKPIDGINYYDRHYIDIKSIPINAINLIDKFIYDKLKSSLKLKSIWINRITDETNKNDNYHQDVSKLTFVLYLNDNFHGGEFEYIDEKSKLPTRITPKKNLALLMSDKLVHRVKPVREGVRYSLIGFFDYYEKKTKSLL